MATRLYKVYPNSGESSITQEVGLATDAAPIELTVDLAADIIDNGGSSERGLLKEEVLRALDQLKNHILSKDFP
jgi:hypothetical protein